VIGTFGKGSNPVKLYDLLDGLPGVGGTVATKLLARKRPRSIPIVDSVVIASNSCGTR